MTTHNTHPLPSLPQLFKATGIALVVAAAILITTVLPAEHGIDPTGIGKALGLTTLSAPETETETEAASALIPDTSAARQPDSEIAAAPAAQASAPIVTASEAPFRSDEMMLTLQPGEGDEIKATMRQGEQFVFSWKAEGGKVNFDMHGERVNAGSDFTSYWKDQQQTSAQGTFVAPFDGTHGWFWRNRGDRPVTVTVKVSGFYASLQQAK
ncbi:MAG: hypothetical protein GZ085_03955 [Sulfuriferula multivorans]|uniref:Transmembrane anchor protein n=1 Tax=Sulfuriferula multivorans TaxID=1559896 RepID=A0A7C9NQJ1_9PROT|nr:hypothetical protein [Sulfuriferula multivorans]